MRNTNIKRLRYLIYPSFQLRILFVVILVLLLADALVIGWLYHFNNAINRETVTTIQQISETVMTEDQIVQSFVKYAASISSHRYELRTDKILTDHQDSIEKINASLSGLEQTVKGTVRTLQIICAILSVQLIIVIILTVHFTFHTAGPVIIMRNIIRDLREGRKPSLRSLRKRDEFRELHDEIVALARMLEK